MEHDSSMNILEIKNLTKHYGKFKAVDAISLSIQPGEIFAFIGENGAGKTTTIKAACGILSFDSGSIAVNGHDVKTEPFLCKKQIAYIPDNPDLYDFLSGIAYLSFIADIYGISAEERRCRIEKYADLFALTKDLAQPIASYSHGMKQKLALIAAFIHEPKLLLMDEPFVGLDPKAAFTLKQIMRDICEAGGAIFFSTHVLDVAEKLCDKVAIIKDGKIIAQGDMAAVRGDQSLENLFLTLTEQEQGV